MHLPNEIQIRLDKLSAGLKLDGRRSHDYCFYDDQVRSFSAALTGDGNAVLVFFFDKPHRHCYAKGVFHDLDRLANAVTRWANRQELLPDIIDDYGELELFKDFDFRNPNDEIDRAWRKVKNKFFQEIFWDNEWLERYTVMLTEAKRHKAFENYFPFTSHYWLRFSVDKGLKETWLLDTYIIPTIYSDQMPKTLGKFYVSYNDTPMGGQFFETAETALDFYAAKLQETKPIKWSVRSVG